MDRDYCPFRGDSCHSLCAFLQDGRCLLRAAAEKFVASETRPEPAGSATLAPGVVVPASTPPKRRRGRPRKVVTSDE